MSHSIGKLTRVKDLPDEVWIHIFSCIDIRAHRTKLAIRRVSRHWKALFEMSRTDLYKHLDVSSVPYRLNPLLDIPLSRSTKFLIQQREYPQDPVFAEPAVLPPVMASDMIIWVKGSDPKDTKFQHNGTLTVGDVLKVVEMAFTEGANIAIYVQNTKSRNEPVKPASINVDTSFNEACLSFNSASKPRDLSPWERPPRRNELNEVRARDVLRWMFFKTSEKVSRHYY